MVTTSPRTKLYIVLESSRKFATWTFDDKRKSYGVFLSKEKADELVKALQKTCAIERRVEVIETYSVDFYVPNHIEVE
jgi:hypothetical protein